MKRRAHHLIPMILGLLLAGPGCFPKRSSIPKDDPSKDAASSEDAGKDTADSEAISPPVPITGSYLHCEINDKDLAVDNRAEVGCRIDDGSTRNKVELLQLYNTANFLHQRPANPNVLVTGAVAPVNSPYHVVYSFQGTAEPLSLETLRNFLVMFRANPKTAQANQFIFSARLMRHVTDGALLPENFPVFYANGTIINQPAPGFERRILPTVNHSYQAIDGCYIACYSNSAVDAVYPVGPDIHVMGQFRVKGIYTGRFCQGAGFEAATRIDEIPEYKAACGQHIPACAGDICWGGNDTGGWFGFQ